MKKKKLYIAIVIGIIVVGGGLYLYKKNNSNVESIRYITELVQKGTLSSTIVASGSIVVDSQETVDPTISGTITDLAVKVGDDIKKGDFLFNIVNDELNVNVAQSSASYQQALNSLESAKLNKESARAEYEAAKKKDDKDGDAYTSSQLDVLKSKINLAEGSIVQAQKSLTASSASYKNIVSDAGKRRVTSPISGTIIEVSVKNGDELGSSNNNASESAIIVGDLTTLKAEIPINEVDIAKVKVGQKVSISLDALEDTKFIGEVEKIDSIGVATSGVVNYGVTVKFDNLDDRIKPTMSVSAIIEISTKENVVMVPSGAIKSGNRGDYIEVLENEIPKRISVTVGDNNGTNAEIISGISEGEKVIIRKISTVTSSTASAGSSTSGSNRSGSGGNSIRIPGLGGGGPRD